METVIFVIVKNQNFHIVILVLYLKENPHHEFLYSSFLSFPKLSLIF